MCSRDGSHRSLLNMPLLRPPEQIETIIPCAATGERRGTRMCSSLDVVLPA